MNTVSRGTMAAGAERARVLSVSRRRSLRAGFTLVEALVSAALLSVGAVAVLGAIGAIYRTQASAQEAETMQRLAYEKYDELVATSLDITQPQEGDFQDQNETRYNWSMTEEPSGVDNLDAITVTVRKVNDNSANARTAVATGLLYVPPVDSTTGTTGATQ